MVFKFNELITSRLLTGAVETLHESAVREENISIKWVPGAFELPQAAQRMAKSGLWDVLVALGCVIRGETSHYEVVVSESTKGITQVAFTTGIPIALGILTTENIEQAMERAGGRLGNKGADAALAAIKMSILYRDMERSD